MRLHEFLICTGFGAWLIIGAQRGRWFPTIERAPMPPAKVREALRTLQDTVVPEEVLPQAPVRRDYSELQEAALAEISQFEQDVADFGPVGATFMSNSEEGYSGPGLPEGVEAEPSL